MLIGVCFFLSFFIIITRHDYLGRSTARDSFLIWTHHMKEITFHDSFSPTGATDSVTYDNGLFPVLGEARYIADSGASLHLRGRCAMV